MGRPKKNSDLLDSIEIVDEDIAQEDGDDIKAPTIQYTDPRWNDYVLSQFTAEELFEGNPTVDGLRRVVEILVGEVVMTRNKVVQVPSSDNNNRATVQSRVMITTHEGQPREYSGCADAYGGNTLNGYDKYPVALAETRAEGRALRRALRLRNAAAEEIGTQKVDNKEDDSKINTNQLHMIDILTKNDERGLNINTQKFIEAQQDEGGVLYNVKSLSYVQGQQLIKVLGTYQQDTSKIPPELVGYEDGWRVKLSL